MLINIPISLYFGLKQTNIWISLAIINAFNLFIFIWELYQVYQKWEILIRYKGRFNVYIVLPVIALWNLYKENDIYLDLNFINQLAKMKTDSPYLIIAQIVFVVTIIPRIIATISFAYQINSYF